MNANMNMNNMNNMNMNSNIEQMNQTISSAIGNTVMQSVNANNSSNMNMNLNSENENRQSKIIEVPVPVPVFVNPIIEMPRVPLSVVNTPIITSTPTTVYV